MNESALIGRVTAVFSGAAQVTLLTDTGRSGTAPACPRAPARAASSASSSPSAPATPTTCCCATCRPAPSSTPATACVTRGTVTDRDDLSSLYPRGLPIGVITRIDNEGTDTEEVHLRPYANMRDLDFVQVLTRPSGPGT